MSTLQYVPSALPAPLRRSALPKDTGALARFLLGKLVVREIDGISLAGRIVETEAYLPDDPACHAFRGMTARNRSLFLAPGHAYVYLCYGTSYLLNVSSEEAGVGAGVLLRALEPQHGFDDPRLGRATRADRTPNPMRGPGRLTAALAVDRRFDGIDLCARGPLWLGDGPPAAAIGVSTRIGLTKGAEARLRFFVAGSSHLSGPKRLNAACTPADAHPV
jgi:DNA-3-methyladenine glycosylase